MFATCDMGRIDNHVLWLNIYLNIEKHQLHASFWLEKHLDPKYIGPVQQLGKSQLSFYDGQWLGKSQAEMPRYFGFPFFINIAYFETFGWTFLLSANLFFLKSVMYIVYILYKKNLIELFSRAWRLFLYIETLLLIQSG